MVQGEGASYPDIENLATGVVDVFSSFLQDASIQNKIKGTGNSFFIMTVLKVKIFISFKTG